MEGSTETFVKSVYRWSQKFLDFTTPTLSRRKSLLEICNILLQVLLHEDSKLK